jgi:hypothetical protein
MNDMLIEAENGAEEDERDASEAESAEVEDEWTKTKKEKQDDMLGKRQPTEVIEQLGFGIGRHWNRPSNTDGL